MEMKEIKNLEPVELKNYGVKVNRYLTYVQIQQIIDAVKSLDEWSARKQAIDMLVLYHATDASKEDLEKIGIDNLLCSGFVDDVVANVINYNDIFKALKYTESTERALAQILARLPEYFKPLEKVVKKHERNSSK